MKTCALTDLMLDKCSWLFPSVNNSFSTVVQTDGDEKKNQNQEFQRESNSFSSTNFGLSNIDDPTIEINFRLDTHVLDVLRTFLLN